MLNFPPTRQGFPASEALAARRLATARPDGYTQIEAVTVTERSIGGVACVVADITEAAATILHIHGGGFRIGSPQRLSGFASHLAAVTQARVVLPRYSLSPESPFPKALHEIAAVSTALQLEGVGSLLIGGDSCGGNLATVIAQNQSPGFFAAVLLISPWTDLTVSAPSFTRNALTDQLFSQAAASEASDFYRQGVAANDPLVSPLFGDLSQLPPTLIIAGGAEVLLDDSLSLATKMAQVNAQVELHCVPDMQHVAVTLSPTWVGSAYSLQIIGAFARRWIRP